MKDFDLVRIFPTNRSAARSAAIFYDRKVQYWDRNADSPFCFWGGRGDGYHLVSLLFCVLIPFSLPPFLLYGRRRVSGRLQYTATRFFLCCSFPVLIHPKFRAGAEV